VHTGVYSNPKAFVDLNSIYTGLLGFGVEQKPIPAYPGASSGIITEPISDQGSFVTSLSPLKILDILATVANSGSDVHPRLVLDEMLGAEINTAEYGGGAVISSETAVAILDAIEIIPATDSELSFWNRRYRMGRYFVTGWEENTNTGDAELVKSHVGCVGFVESRSTHRRMVLLVFIELAEDLDDKRNSQLVEGIFDDVADQVIQTAEFSVPASTLAN